jgi:hypothetical protein
LIGRWEDTVELTQRLRRQVVPAHGPSDRELG